MKAIKNSENFKLGLISLFFISLFLYSNLLKSSIDSISKPVEQNQNKYTFHSNSRLSFTNQSKETLIKIEDSNLENNNNVETDFESFDGLLSQKIKFNFEILSHKLVINGVSTSLKLITTLPLYDLFCNWKLHLL